MTASSLHGKSSTNHGAATTESRDAHLGGEGGMSVGVDNVWVVQASAEVRFNVLPTLLDVNAWLLTGLNYLHNADTAVITM